MAKHYIQLNDQLYDYMLSVSVDEHPVLREIRDYTQQLGSSNYMTLPEQGQLLGFLVKLLGVKNALEIGTYTGYSATAMALALPADGQLITCDINEAWTKKAKIFWQQAGIINKIDLRLAPALDTLAQLRVEGKENHFDLVFIDANKNSYPQYYDVCLPLLTSGGLMIIDNVLWHGKVADAENQEKSTQAIRRLNEKIYADQRVEVSMLPMGDGMTLVRKR
ncbi:MAG: class I SAM-dependent methyltransferase [Gammaproteobacteria bacterium]|nr:class I SAM-dependent methyltransferase [Gammaproteobacteria bacterium]